MNTGHDDAGGAYPNVKYNELDRNGGAFIFQGLWNMVGKGEK